MRSLESLRLSKVKEELSDEDATAKEKKKREQARYHAAHHSGIIYGSLWASPLSKFKPFKLFY